MSRVLLALLGLAGTAHAASCHVQFDTIIATPDAQQLVVVAAKTCRTGLRIPDFSGWSEGRCFPAGTCGGSTTLLGWRVDRIARTTTPMPLDEAQLCDARLLPGPGPLMAKHFQGGLPVLLRHCDRFRKEEPGDAPALIARTATRGASGYLAEHRALGLPLQGDGALPAGMAWRKAPGFPLESAGRAVLLFDEESKAPRWAP